MIFIKLNGLEVKFYHRNKSKLMSLNEYANNNYLLKAVMKYRKRIYLQKNNNINCKMSAF